MLNYTNRLIVLKTWFYNAGNHLLHNKSKIKVIKRLIMDELIVQTRQGKLRGALRNNIDGGKYFSFRGIPYGEPPVGNLRFKEPQPLQAWTGIRDALDESKASAQYDLQLNDLKGGDDCLYLNVATNSLTGNRPVMLWIHGGGFLRSSNTYQKYSPDYLLKKDIVFVSINYRLGVLGFLNMHHEECAGNQGLKDQVAALKWIQENIQVFGGDSKNVTIFGESAGGASVHGLCMSPQAKGLFQKAIIQSGVIFNPWANISSNKEYGYFLAKTLGKECSTPLEVIEFLRTIPALELVKTFEVIYKQETTNLLLSQVPTSDNSSTNPMFPYAINEMRNHGIDVPIIIGYNSHEGIIMFLMNRPEFIKEINDKFETIIDKYMRINNTEKLTEIAKVVREFYFGKDEITEEKINELVQFFGDMLFVNSIHEVADIQMQHNSQTYLYKFSYRSNYPGIKERFNIKIEGTCHGDELGCLFFATMRRTKLLEGTRDRKAMERITTMWTNFAKTGNPTPVVDELITNKWLPLEKNKKNCFEISDNLICSEHSDDQTWKMWKSLLESV